MSSSDLIPLEPVEGSRSLALESGETWPIFAPDEIAAVAEVLRSGEVNQWTGTTVHEFEKAFVRYVGAEYGLAVANGSVALELCLRALDIGPGDEVVVSPRSFVASAHCVRMVGASPVFADVDLDSGNITAAAVAAVLTLRSRAILPVHVGGWPADMPAIMALADQHGLKVVEDCAQAQGASIAGRHVGSFGDAGAFSFCQDKIMSTGGEGGFAVFRDETAWQWACSFKDHGRKLSRTDNQSAGVPGRFRFEIDRIGTNWRLTAMQAAIGLVQLGKLEEWNALRTRNASVWAAALSGTGDVRVPQVEPPFRHAFYKFHFYINRTGICATRAVDHILMMADAAGLRVFSGGCSEIYRERAYADLGSQALPHARALGETALMMEVHPTLRLGRLRCRARALRDIVRAALSDPG